MKDCVWTITHLLAILSTTLGLPIDPLHYHLALPIQGPATETLDLLASLAGRQEHGKDSTASQANTFTTHSRATDDRYGTSTALSIGLKPHPASPSGKKKGRLGNERGQSNQVSLLSVVQSQSAPLIKGPRKARRARRDKGKALAILTGGVRKKPRKGKPVSGREEGSLVTDAKSVLDHLFEYTTPDNTRHRLTSDNVLAFIGMTKYKIKYKKKRDPTYEVGYGVKSASQLPNLQNYRKMPCAIELEAMASSEREKWINALKLAKDYFESEDQQTSKTSQFKWIDSLPRSALEQLPNGRTEDSLNEEQRQAIAEHRQKFKTSEMTIGKVKDNNDERHEFMTSHRKIRKLGVPWPKPPGGKDSLSLESFKAGLERLNARKREKKREARRRNQEERARG